MHGDTWNPPSLSAAASAGLLRGDELDPNIFSLSHSIAHYAPLSKVSRRRSIRLCRWVRRSRPAPLTRPFAAHTKRRLGRSGCGGSGRLGPAPAQVSSRAPAHLVDRASPRPPDCLDLPRPACPQPHRGSRSGRDAARPEAGPCQTRSNRRTFESTRPEERAGRETEAAQ